jgi:hypothetical protein
VSESTLPSVFIGSSSEGRIVARYLQAELGRSCTVRRWDQGVFEPGGYTLDSLLDVANKSDFAVLIATADDMATSRGYERPVARDNVILEYGLFVGVLGRNRTYLLATGDLHLPSDVLGLTRLPYDAEQKGQAAVSQAALKLEERFEELGLGVNVLSDRPSSSAEAAALDQEIALLCRTASSQGWEVRANTSTALRLRSPRGRQYALPKARSDQTRDDLRVFAAKLQASGLRVNAALLRPKEESPFA